MMDDREWDAFMERIRRIPYEILNDLYAKGDTERAHELARFLYRHGRRPAPTPTKETMTMAKKDLVQIIRDNPGCVATIDNDCWHLHKAPPKPVGEMTEHEWNDWQENGLLARDGEVEPLGDGGYGSGCCYGGDILQALAVIVGIKVESV